MIGGAGDVTVVLDALNECEARRDLLDWLASQKTENLRILVTSRSEDDIKISLTRWIPPAAIVPIQKKPVDEDIRDVVRSRLTEDEGLQRWKKQPEVRTEIETKIMEKADEMFRWAACQLDVFKDCRHLKSLREALSSLPETVDKTYSRILVKISKGDKVDAIRLLQFLTFSERPLRLEEAVDAIAVSLAEEPAFETQNRMPQPKETAQVCSSLVKMTTRLPGQDQAERAGEHKGVCIELQLAHFSIKEYLVSTRVEESFKAKLQEHYARCLIMEVSIAYLVAAAQTTDAKTANARPLARYASEY